MAPWSAVQTRASQAAIQEILCRSAHPCSVREAAAPAYEDRKDWERFWLVDPLDGTESFLKSRSGFAVNIALCDETGPIFGVVADPLSNRMYLGGAGMFNLPPSMAPRFQKFILPNPAASSPPCDLVDGRSQTH